MPKNYGKKSSSTHTRELLHACVFLLAIASASAFGTRVKDFFKKTSRARDASAMSLPRAGGVDYPAAPESAQGPPLGLCA